MKKIYLIIIILLAQLQVFSENWEWEKILKSSQGQVSAKACVSDEKDNTFICGYLDDSVYEGAYIAKIDNKGNLLWMRHSAAGAMEFYSIDRDSSGNLYTTGTGYASSIMVIEKFDAAGNSIWFRKSGGHIRYPLNIGKRIKVDPAGNIYLTGDLEESLEIGDKMFYKKPGYGNFTFLARISADGNCSWVQMVQSKLSQNQGNGISFKPNGNILFAGNCNDSTSIGDNVFALEGSNGFCLEFSPSGDLLNSSFIKNASIFSVISKGNSDYLAVNVPANTDIITTGFSYHPVKNESILLKAENNSLRIIKTEEQQLFQSIFLNKSQLYWLQDKSVVTFNNKDQFKSKEEIGQLVLGMSFTDKAYFVSGHFMGTVNFGSQQYTNTSQHAIAFLAKHDILDCVDCSAIPEYKLPLFDVFPNPSLGKFSIKIPASANGASFSIYDIFGRRVSYSVAADFESVTEIELNQVTKGVYFIELRVNNEIQRRKVIIQ